MWELLARSLGLQPSYQGRGRAWRRTKPSPDTQELQGEDNQTSHPLVPYAANQASNSTVNPEPEYWTPYHQGIERHGPEEVTEQNLLLDERNSTRSNSQYSRDNSFISPTSTASVNNVSSSIAYKGQISKTTMIERAYSTSPSFRKNDEHESSHHNSNMFTPFWLFKTTLCSFVLLYLLMSVALAVLYYVSEREHGFSTKLSTNHYYWTYGPTFVLVIVASFWRQVGYWCMIMMPWKVMQKGFASPEVTVLLDYVSIISYTAMWNAAKNQHWEVLGATAGGLLLKIMTVFSTGLLTLQQTAMVGSASLMMTTKFNASNFNSTSIGTLVNNSDYGPGFVYFGIIDQNLTPPNGTTLNAAFETFDSAGYSNYRNVSFSGNVTSIYPDIYCESAIINASIPMVSTFGNDVYDSADLKWSFQSNSGNCTLPETGRNSPPLIYVGYYSGGPPSSRQIQLVSTRTACQERPDDNNAWVFALIDIQYNKTLDNGARPTSGGNYEIVNGLEIANTSGAVCYPHYTMKVARATYNRDSKDISNSTSPSFSVTASSELTDTALADLKFDAIQWSLDNTMTSYLAESTTSTAFGNTSMTQDGESNTWFALMAAENNRSSVSAFLDPEILMRSARNVYRGVASQAAAQYMLVPNNESATGDMTYSENRLHIRFISVISMEVCLVALIGITILIYLRRPHACVSRDPTTIAYSMAILSKSNSLKDSLTGTGKITEEQLHHRIHNLSFMTTLRSSANEGHPHFSIIQRTNKIEVNRDIEKSSDIHSPPKFWKPLSLNTVIKILTIVIPIIIIVSLEILQQSSDRNHGLFKLTTDSQYHIFDRKSLSTYIPAAILLCVALLYSSLSESTALLAPYLQLKKMLPGRKEAIFTSILGKLPPFILWDSIKHRHTAVLFATVASLFGNWLSIIVSGLYTSNDVSLPQAIVLSRSDNFDLDWKNSLVEDNHAAGILNLIEHYNMSFPSFTYGELVFPTIQIYNSTPSQNLVSGDHLQVALPALRARLECAVLNKTETNTYNGTAYHDPTPTAYVQATVPLPSNCLTNWLNETRDFLNYSMTFDFPILNIDYQNESDTTYANSIFGGQLTDLHTGPFSEDSLSSYFGEPMDEATTTEPASEEIPDNQEGCPTLGIAFGQFSKDTLEPPTYTALGCYQYIQEVMTNVTLTLPNLSIDKSRPPIPDESTAHYLSNGTANGFTRSYRPQLNLANSLALFESSGASFETTTDANLDPFFSMVLYGVDGVPAEELLGPENVGKLENATQHAYALYMAQAISLNMRQSISTSNGSNSSTRAIGNENTAVAFNATVIDSVEERLVQNKLSKIILQAILGSMALCAIFTYISIGRGDILTKNPASIAGVMSLLADSNSLSESIMPSDSEWLSSNELREAFRGWIFRLGWQDLDVQSEMNTETVFGIFMDEDKESYVLLTGS